jgi:hypothetical protein
VNQQAENVCDFSLNLQIPEIALMVNYGKVARINTQVLGARTKLGGASALVLWWAAWSK